MSLRWYRRPRLVALKPDSPVLEAARALENNEIGAVLVLERGCLVGMVTDRDLAIRALGRGLDPSTAPLSDVMSEVVATLPPEAERSEAIALMKKHRVRRIPLVEKGGKLVGMVTLDDLILDETVSLDEVSEVVHAQLGEGGPAASPRSPAAQRSMARAQSTYRQFLSHLQNEADLDSLAITQSALDVILPMIVRRLMPDEAENFIAQLPSMLQPTLRSLRPGPDTSIDRDAIVSELVQRLDVDPERAGELLEVIGFEVLMGVTEGEAEDVQRQLPRDLRDAILAPPPR